MKATPAPWTARKIENPDSEDFAIWAGDRVIARTLSVRADAEANARLMAASPSLLAIAKRWTYFKESLVAANYDANSPTIKALIDETEAAIAEAGAQ